MPAACAEGLRASARIAHESHVLILVIMAAFPGVRCSSVLQRHRTRATHFCYTQPVRPDPTTELLHAREARAGACRSWFHARAAPGVDRGLAHGHRGGRGRSGRELSRYRTRTAKGTTPE